MFRTIFMRVILASLIPIPPFAFADGIQDNDPLDVRPIPPVGIQLDAAERMRIEYRLRRLRISIDNLKRIQDSQIQELLPDVEIFARAVAQGLQHRELFTERDVRNTQSVLDEGIVRAHALLDGNAPWLIERGLVVRGYRSKIDQTVQPYGLVIPANYRASGRDRYRCDLWFHGRGERSSESVFIAERMTKIGRFDPEDTIVLHPYGRYSNAFKFAGEVDVLEALEHAKRFYRIDEDRIAVRGFSMGGAGCWQMAVHYPDLFFAANPGAGFAETPKFLKFFQKETLAPTWFEKKLWQLYDCNSLAANLFNLPTVAYSGELDIQKQAADIMEAALKKEGIRLTHVIGKKTKHTIDEPSKSQIEQKLKSLAKIGRNRLPQKIRFVTYTLKYNRVHWMQVDALGEHWKQARVDASLDIAQNAIRVRAKNITGLTINIPSGYCPFALDKPVQLMIERAGEGSVDELALSQPESDRSFHAQVHLNDKTWKLGPSENSGLQKKRDLQGPIDDAFMGPFVVVRPTGSAANPLVDKWSKAECDRLVREWRRQFRGDAIVKKDSDISENDVQEANLILFGDPSSNSILRKLIDELPLQWTQETIQMDEQTFSASDHAPIMIYPNPLNPDRYVVVNSGFTYREYAYLNNARQVPKLPDWAVVDLTTPPNSLWPGKIKVAGFFDESWDFQTAPNP